MKFIIFDLDETLGYFKQLYYIFSVIKKINSSFSITQTIFNRVLELYPEFLRPMIVDILLYLKRQKQFNRNTYIIIYTNNTHPNWTKYIISYIEQKINEPSEISSLPFFDRIISSQKSEVCRQYQKKHLDDLFRCIDYSFNSPICYIDNEYHPGMRSRQTNYCKLEGYINNLPINIISERLYSSLICNEIIPNVTSTVFNNIYLHYCEKKYNKVLTEAEYRHEYRTSQELMLKIRIFFMNSTTHKRRHTYSSTPSTELSIRPEIINRVSEPLFNYYTNIGSSSNKTKKNRRVI